MRNPKSSVIAAISMVVLSAGAAGAEQVPVSGLGHLEVTIGQLAGLAERHHSERYSAPSAGVMSDGSSAIAELPCSEDPGCVSFDVNDSERFFEIAIHDKSRQSIGAIVAGNNRTYTVCQQNSRFKLDKGESKLEVRVVPTLCSSGQGVPTRGEIALTFARSEKVLDSQPDTPGSKPSERHS